MDDMAKIYLRYSDFSIIFNIYDDIGLLTDCQENSSVGF